MNPHNFKVMIHDTCYAVTVEYGVAYSDIYNTKTLKTCAESDKWDVGDNVEICVRPEEPLPPDNFSCSDGTELPTVIAANGNNCYSLCITYEVLDEDIYNVNTGNYCPIGAVEWAPGDTIRICKREREPFCNGVTFYHTVDYNETCDRIVVRYDVNYGDIYNTRTGLICSQDVVLPWNDKLLICDTSGVAATIAE
jgi:hypothetical protein